MATPVQVWTICKEYITTLVDSVAGLASSGTDAIRNYLINDSSPMYSIVYPAYARGIGYVQIADSSQQGYHLTDGTLYLPGGVNPSEAVTIFSAGGGLYSVVVTDTDSHEMGFTKRNDGSYYYRFQTATTGAKIHSYWGDTEYINNLNGVYIGAGNYYVPQYPGALSGQVMCKLKYFTYSSYKTTVDNSGGTDVPTDYTVLVNIPVGGDTIDYNTYCTEVVNQYNYYYPDSTISPEDVPDWDDIIDYVYPPTTEPTEPVTEPTTSDGGFVFDYNEVVSPSELRQILGQETYELETIDDKGILTVEVPTLPDATFSAEGLNIFVDSVGAGQSLLSSFGLWTPFVACAVVVILFRFLR